MNKENPKLQVVDGNKQEEEQQSSSDPLDVFKQTLDEINSEFADTIKPFIQKLLNLNKQFEEQIKQRKLKELSEDDIITWMMSVVYSTVLNADVLTLTSAAYILIGNSMIPHYTMIGDYSCINGLAAQLASLTDNIVSNQRNNKPDPYQMALHQKLDMMINELKKIGGTGKSKIEVP